MKILLTTSLLLGALLAGPLCFSQDPDTGPRKESVLDPVKVAYEQAEKTLAFEVSRMTESQLAHWDLADLSVRLNAYFKEAGVAPDTGSVLSGKLLAEVAEIKADAAAYLAEQRTAKPPTVTASATTPQSPAIQSTNTYGRPVSVRSKPSPITRSGTISQPSGSGAYSIDRRGAITVYGRDGATFVD